jgi:hypothetical protein
MALKNMKKYLDIDGFTGGMTEEVTPWAGVGLFLELYRHLQIGALAEQTLPVKKSEKGLRHGEMTEAFLLMSALGGENLDDFGNLRRDEGLRAILGYQLPAPETARQWLKKAHEEPLIKVAKEKAEQLGFLSYIPAESVYLQGFNKGNRRVIAAYATTVKPSAEVTLDVDAHLVESAKQSAFKTYEGYDGYQPMIVTWAETNLVLRDEFRDGNVPAEKDIARIVDEAYDNLPQREDKEEWKVFVRSDSAAYEEEILDHWHNRGWKFAVSADMSPQLRRTMVAKGEDEWQLKQEYKNGVICEWAEVAYVPSRQVEKKGTEVPIYRYLGIRMRNPQGQLFGDVQSVRYYAVVSNRWDMEGLALLNWQRGKAGTVEHVHHILLSELGAGVYPSDKFGANAAWLRLQVLTHNLLELLKATVLPAEFRKARPKRLRFAVFTQFGRVVRHAHKIVVRITTRALELLMGPGRRRIRSIAWCGG